MNPPIREQYHQDELWKGMLDGTIECIATDHAPHTLEEKKLPYGQAPSGMPGVETSLTLMLNEVSNQRITIEQVVKWMCENPVKVYNIQNKGFLKVGYDADIAIVDMNKEKILSGSNMQSKCGWTAFEGTKTTGHPIITIVNGNIVYKDGKIIDNFKGKPVKFNE
jgi:dihydroorotase